MFKYTVMSECTALLGQKSGVGGVSDSGFSSCTAPTYYCGSEYFYSQHPQVWNLIGTERSLNRSEDAVAYKDFMKVAMLFLPSIELRVKQAKSI